MQSPLPSPLGHWSSSAPTALLLKTWPRGMVSLPLSEAGLMLSVGLEPQTTMEHLL